jgi:carbonic anhydrase
MTPASAVEKLKKGNARFVEKNMRSRDWLAKVSATAGGQYPFAVILACMDSRAPIKIIFDQGIGDVFGIRIAGNIVNEDVLGSMEYATKVVGSKLLVVLGHTSCEAVKGCIDDAKLGNLTGLLAKIRPRRVGIRPRKLERRRVRHESRPGQRVSGDEGDSREESDDKGSARRRYGRPRRSDLRCLHG